ncbi:glycosyltransferase WbuB, partial [Paraclostridium benzoelyticum]|nr:glycosyltransferase WbuB [Paraclostridium benzoelyticum]
MKIFYVTQFYYPERAAGAFRAIDNSVIWSENGADVTIYTTYPNFPSGKIFKGYENKTLSKEQYKKIKIYRNKIIVNENTSKIRRAISSLSFMMYSIKNIIFKAKEIGTDYDVVLGTSGTILAPII